MSAVPARVAGVREIRVCTPPGPDGLPDRHVLAVAGLLGLDEVYAVGGAQAVGALAYGTESVAAVDKIVGPGNDYVTAAKLEVFGIVGIDAPQGPSEVLVIADASAFPERRRPRPDGPGRAPLRRLSHPAHPERAPDLGRRAAPLRRAGRARDASYASKT